MADMTAALRIANSAETAYYFHDGIITDEQKIQIALGVFLGQSVKEAIIEGSKNIAKEIHQGMTLIAGAHIAK